MRGKGDIRRSLYISVHFGSSSNSEIYKVITSSIKLHLCEDQLVERNEEAETHVRAVCEGRGRSAYGTVDGVLFAGGITALSFPLSGWLGLEA